MRASCRQATPDVVARIRSVGGRPKDALSAHSGSGPMRVDAGHRGVCQDDHGRAHNGRIDGNQAGRREHEQRRFLGKRRLHRLHKLLVRRWERRLSDQRRFHRHGGIDGNRRVHLCGRLSQHRRHATGGRRGCQRGKHPNRRHDWHRRRQHDTQRGQHRSRRHDGRRRQRWSWRHGWNRWCRGGSEWLHCPANRRTTQS